MGGIRIRLLPRGTYVCIYPIDGAFHRETEMDAVIVVGVVGYCLISWYDVNIASSNCW